MGNSLKTHEKKNFVGISFPTFYHLPVLYNSLIEIHRKQSSRAIGKVEVSSLPLLPDSCNIWRDIYAGVHSVRAKRWPARSDN
jgi:hypothetical protein